MLLGQLIVGAVLSTTVTVVEHVSDAPLSSVTVNVTTVIPNPYGPSGLWLVVIGSSSGSYDPLSTSASALQSVPAKTVTLLHSATGGRFVNPLVTVCVSDVVLQLSDTSTSMMLSPSIRFTVVLNDTSLGSDALLVDTGVTELPLTSIP